MDKIPKFRFWCQKVLPLVYDNSLSYYEVLCKVVEYLNDLIADNKIMADEITALQADLRVVEEWIANFNTSYAEKIIGENLMHMIIVNITEDGYIKIIIPDGWDAITFNTTGFDIDLPLQPEYGHLVLSY